MRGVTACIPSVRGDLAAPTIHSVVNQTVPPVRILLNDARNQVSSNFLLEWVCGHTGTEHRRVPKLGVTASRNQMAKAADTNLLWFVDDDVWPYHDCLEQMVEAMAKYDVSLVVATVPDVIPQENQAFGPQPWNRARKPRNNDVYVPYVDTLCVLVSREAWLWADEHYEPDSQGGEDILTTAPIAFISGAVCASRATGVHVRTAPSTWRENPVDRAWLDEKLKPRMSPDGYAAFLHSVGEEGP